MKNRNAAGALLALLASEEPEDAMYHDSLLSMARREPEKTPEED